MGWFIVRVYLELVYRFDILGLVMIGIIFLFISWSNVCILGIMVFKL